MGFLKSIFSGRDISTEEKAQRTITEKPKPLFEKPLEEMTSVDMVYTWSVVRDIDDPYKRIEPLEALEKAGIKVAAADLRDAYLEIGRRTGHMAWDKITYWAGKAAETDVGLSHKIYSNILGNEENPEFNLEKSMDELVKGVRCGDILCVEAIIKLQNGMKKRGLDLYVRAVEFFREKLEPVVWDVEQTEGTRSDRIRGMLYYYGLYYPLDIRKAAQFLKRAADKGDFDSTHLLKDPVFREFN